MTQCLYKYSLYIRVYNDRKHNNRLFPIYDELFKILV